MPLPPILSEEEGLDEGQTIAARIRRWDEGEPRGPYTMELYPTMTCNIDCVFCDTTYRKGKQSGELTAEQYWRILEEAEELGVRRIFLLGGGEPLVRRDVTPELMRRIKAAGIEGHIATNGTLFDEPLAGTSFTSRSTRRTRPSTTTCAAGRGCSRRSPRPCAASTGSRRSGGSARRTPRGC